MAIAAAKKRGLKVLPTAPYMRDGDPKTSGVGFGFMMHESKLDQPLRWTKPRKIFVNSMSDLWHEEMDEYFLDQIFAVMALAKQHTFQVLTKRPERMLAYINWDNNGDFYDFEDRRSRVLYAIDERLGIDKMTRGSAEWKKAIRDPRRSFEWPLPNVWLGTSVENARWRTRIDALRQVDAAVRFLSCEPLLGPLVNVVEKSASVGFSTASVTDASKRPGLDLTGIDWVITGGESGHGARPMDEQWVRDIRDECKRQHVAFFNKQMGEVWSREHLSRSGHGGDIETFPPDLQVRQYAGDQHDWVDARNEVVASGEVCVGCGRVRAGNSAAPLTLSLA
jgi:protein gp37